VFKSPLWLLSFDLPDTNESRHSLKTIFVCLRAHLDDELQTYPYIIWRRRPERERMQQDSSPCVHTHGYVVPERFSTHDVWQGNRSTISTQSTHSTNPSPLSHLMPVSCVTARGRDVSHDTSMHSPQPSAFSLCITDSPFASELIVDVAVNTAKCSGCAYGRCSTGPRLADRYRADDHRRGESTGASDD